MVFGINDISTVLGFCSCPHILRVRWWRYSFLSLLTGRTSPGRAQIILEHYFHCRGPRWWERMSVFCPLMGGEYSSVTWVMWVVCPGLIPDYAVSKRLISIRWECPWPLTSFSEDLLVGNLILGGSWLEPMYLGWVSFLRINRACVSPVTEVWHLLTALNSLTAFWGGSFCYRGLIFYISHLFVFCRLWVVNLHLQLQYSSWFI